jgi:hypothetical protein
MILATKRMAFVTGPEDWQENKRSLNSRLLASSKPEKIVNYINKTSNNSPK